MHRAPGTSTSAPPNRRGGEPSRRALDAMAEASRRAQRADGEPPVIDQGNEETGTRRLVARSTARGDAAGSAAAGSTAARSGTQRLVARSTKSGGARRGAAPMAIAPDDRPPAPDGSSGTPAAIQPGPRSSSRWSDGWAAWSDRWAGWHTRWELDGRRTRAILATCAVAILIVAVAGIALALALRSPTRTATSRTGAARRPSVSHRSALLPAKGSKAGGKATHGVKGTKGTKGTKAAPASTTPTTSPPTTSAAPAPTGAPRLSSASPSSGAAGQTVVIDGSGLFSSNGQVLAYFGGTDAPTSCSSQTSCTVTVPDLGGGPATVPLTIVTSRGRSNAVRFSYR